MSDAIRIASCRPGDALFAELVDSGQVNQEPNLHCVLVAQRSGRICGHVAVYGNPGIRHAGQPTIQLGAFACLPDPSLAEALLNGACRAGSALGAAFALGPMDGSTWKSYRYITSGSNTAPFLTEVQHPDYYPALWESAGFGAVEDYVSNLAPVSRAPVPPDFFTAQGLTVRRLDPACLNSELRMVYPLCMSAFAHSPYFTAIPKEEFAAQLLPLKPLLAAGFTHIVSQADGAAVAFILCFPDTMDPAGRRLVIKTVAKAPSLAAPGLITVLNQHIMNDAAARGFAEAIHAYMHAGNRSRDRSSDFAGRTIRRYALFARPCV